MIKYLTNSIWPAIVLYTAGNVYSNVDLWLHGYVEWQASSGATPGVHNCTARKIESS